MLKIYQKSAKILQNGTLGCLGGPFGPQGAPGHVNDGNVGGQLGAPGLQNGAKMELKMLPTSSQNRA